MVWRTRFLAVLATVLASLLSVSAQAQLLYAAIGATGATGNLFLVSATNGTTSPVGPLITSGGLPVAITGLAVNPRTGVLYGITANSSPNISAHLVTISTINGLVTDVGAMGTGGADIAFSGAGVLYMSSGNNGNLWTVNLTSGVATIVGATGFGAVSGGGLAINSQGIAVMMPNGASGNVVALNLNNGTGTAGVALTGAPIPAGTINAASYDSNNVLFAVNGTFAGGASNLVTINGTTGAVTSIGVLPANVDALAFATPLSAVPTLSEWTMILMALLLAATGFAAMRRNSR